MTPHRKKLIGTVITLLWLGIYLPSALLLGLRLLAHAGPAVTIAYYLAAGTLWIIPIGLLLPWMYRAPAGER